MLMGVKNNTKRRISIAETDTHIVFGYFVGTGIEKYAYTISATFPSGKYQRRISLLRNGSNLIKCR